MSKVLQGMQCTWCGPHSGRGWVRKLQKLSTDMATVLQCLVCGEQDAVDDGCYGEDASNDGTGARDES